MIQKKMLTINVRNCHKAMFEGEKNSGSTADLESFKKSRTASISLLGTLAGTDEVVQVRFTPGSNGRGEFMALDDIITREGTLEVMGEVKTSFKTLDGEEIEFPLPRVECELSDANGEQTFKFTPRPVAKWAEKYGDFQTDRVNYGEDKIASGALRNRKKAQRKTKPVAGKGSAL